VEGACLGESKEKSTRECVFFYSDTETKQKREKKEANRKQKNAHKTRTPKSDAFAVFLAVYPPPFGIMNRSKV
jgi:hypothetical protein